MYFCYQAPTDAHKQLKNKTMITLTGNSESIQKISYDEKNLTVEEFAEHIINHLEFHGMASECYLSDPQDAINFVSLYEKMLSIHKVG